MVQNSRPAITPKTSRHGKKIQATSIKQPSKIDAQSIKKHQIASKYFAETLAGARQNFSEQLVPKEMLLRPSWDAK